RTPPGSATRFVPRKPRKSVGQMDSLSPREGRPMNPEGMNFDFNGNPGEWLRGVGPDNDIVVSTRIRLARNLASFPFSNRASAHQKAEIAHLRRDRLQKLDFFPKLELINLSQLAPLDRQFLVERQLISRELANTEGPRGVALSQSETISVMIN